MLDACSEEPGDLLCDGVQVNVVEARSSWQTRHGAHLRERKQSFPQLRTKRKKNSIKCKYFTGYFNCADSNCTTTCCNSFFLIYIFESKTFFLFLTGSETQFNVFVFKCSDFSTRPLTQCLIKQQTAAFIINTISSY